MRQEAEDLEWSYIIDLDVEKQMAEIKKKVNDPD